MQRTALYALTFVGLASFGAAACSTTEAGSGNDADGDFISDNPNGGGGGGGSDTGAGTSGGDDGAGEGGDSAGGEDPPTGDGDGDREVSEADVIQMDGDRLYALSRYSGLNVVDASDPTNLGRMGGYTADATPFEMYLDQSQVFAMLTNYGDWYWEPTTDDWTYQQDSRLISLDASNPAAISKTGDFAMPGIVQDSRRVGDVLYVVTYEDGYCWGCGQTPRTLVTSINVADETNPQQIDQVIFDHDQDEYGWQRSVSSTNERMYVSGPMYDPNSGWDRSRIDVVDISDPDGDMRKGDSVNVLGQIRSRWQMDEYEGVLRVVSQPDRWNSNGAAPFIETFTVNSSDDLTRLGLVEMVLPRPEELQAVRFDGARGYAITFERTDPLFTLDLSDPASPRQVGELEIPGFVWHMEPRGDRILALGFDRDNPEGSINVSLFDVSQFDQPTMLSRVHFGGDWASFAEDQDRLHKAFTILDDQDLLLVPFEGWEYEDNGGFEDYCGRYRSGVQVVDWANDSLTKRGYAEGRGQARRAFMHREHLFATSDTAISTFDLSDRDAPAEIDELAVATQVDGAAVTGNFVFRVSRDWYSNQTLLEVTTLDRAGEPQALGVADLSSAVMHQEYECYGGYLRSDMIFSRGNHAYVFIQNYDYESGGETTTLVTVNVSDPTAPYLENTVDLPFGMGYGGYYAGVNLDEAAALMVGEALVVRGRTYTEDGLEQRVRVISLTDPANPTLTGSLAAPNAVESGGLKLAGEQLLTWHADPVGNDQSRLRFYMDLLDLSDPTAPQIQSVNVPGVVVAYDPEAGAALTIDFKRLESGASNEEACWSTPGNWYWDWDNNACYRFERDAKLLSIESGRARITETLDLSQYGEIFDVRAESDRIFMRMGSQDYWYGEGEVGTAVILGNMTPSGVDLATQAMRGWFSNHGDGSRIVVDGYGRTMLLDATDMDAVELRELDMGRNGYCSDMDFVGDTALCSMGAYGLQTIDLK